MPIMHLGRQGLFYWLFPYSTVMGVWPQVRSPLWWDFICLICYILMSIMYYYAGLLPDLATVRDLARSRFKQILYGILALGWRGSARHWRNQQTVYAIMSAIMAPMVISVHSVVGLDYAGGLTTGWHSTQFPPYFFFGAVISGTALIVMLTILVRWGYGLQDVITGYHLNALAKVVLVGSVMLGYAYVWEAFGPIYGSDVAEKTEFFHRMFGFTARAFWAEKILTVIIPQLLWLPVVRRSQPLLFAISGGIIVGMWLERYMFTTASLEHNYMPSWWGTFYPTLWDWAALAGTIGLFLTLFFLALRLVPIVSMAEVREIIEKEKEKSK
jgi:molybdopterin-containing oxidoreductase family membrane subunit